MAQVLNGSKYDVMTHGNDTLLFASALPAGDVAPAVAEDSDGCKLYRFIMNTVVIGSLCCLGMTGNFLSFCVFHKDTMKTSTSFLFQSLSITDSALLLLAIPVYSLKPLMVYLGNDHFIDYVWPYIPVYVFPWAFIAQTAAIWVTVLVGVNRYISVCFPYNAPRWTSVAKAKFYLTIVLILSFLYNIPLFVTRSIVHVTENNRTVPREKPEPNHRLFNIIYYNVCYPVFMLILPLILLTVLSCLLISQLNKLRARRASMQSSERQDSNVTFTLVIVLLVFAVCQVPALITQLLWNILPDSQRDCGGFQYYFSPITNALVILNSAINFVIYVGTNKRFRATLRNHVCPCVTRKSVNGSNHTQQLLTQNTQI